MHSNPKTLKIPAIDPQSNKLVCIGFKAPPQLKIILISNAHERDLTLSAYIAIALSDYENTNADKDQEFEKVNREINQLKEKLTFYEKNPFLVDLFARHKNTELEYTHSKGERVNLKITDVKDVFTVIVNSFKTA